MKLTIYVPESASEEAFVRYWSAHYDRSDDDRRYSPHIGKPLTPEAVHELFIWKNGSRLSKLKRESVEKNYIARLAELQGLSKETPADAFLKLFPTGGAIWRIFWLHLWQPDCFPIYDQHVHRAMSFIQTGEREEVDGWSDERKISAYMERYLPFHRNFHRQDPRDVDRALWAFGKFIKGSQFPEVAREHGLSVA